MDAYTVNIFIVLYIVSVSGAGWFIVQMSYWPLDSNLCIIKVIRG